MFLVNGEASPRAHFAAPYLSALDFQFRIVPIDWEGFIPFGRLQQGDLLPCVRACQELTRHFLSRSQSHLHSLIPSA